MPIKAVLLRPSHLFNWYPSFKTHNLDPAHTNLRAEQKVQRHLLAHPDPHLAEYLLLHRQYTFGNLSMPPNTEGMEPLNRRCML